MSNVALAHAILAAAITAMGGRDNLLALHSVGDTFVGTRSMVEQSERPTGPYFVDQFRVIENVDLDAERVRTSAQHWGYAGPVWWLTQTQPYGRETLVQGDVAGAFDGKIWTYAGGSPIQFAQERVVFGPERVLFTADHSSDVRALPDTWTNGTIYHVIAFTFEGAPCRLTLNAHTYLPWSIEWTRAYPYSIFYNAWGDVTTTLTFNGWTLEPNGVHYPREWTYDRVGLPDQQFSIIELAFNGVTDASLTLPPELIAAHTGKTRAIDAIPFPVTGIKELAPGVDLVSGSWNVGFVQQDDGVVVLEAPISSAYAQQAFSFARAHFGLPVKALITTSDSWPHIAGIREAVAEGIPVFALDLNRPILERLLAAPHRQRPDGLERSPRAPQFHWVSTAVDLGAGVNRLRIAPYRTATAERQMLVYLPRTHLLYTSDLFAPDDVADDGTIRTWFTPQYLAEAISAIEREGFTPTVIWGMHYGPIPYTTIQAALQNFLVPRATP